MSFRNLKSVLLACSGAAVLLAASTAANAGGFALREQSAAGQGASFAGVAAAGGALSSMYWNPATITQYNGKTVELSVSGIMPNASHSFTTSTLGAFGTPGDSGLDALVPSSYASWQLNEKVWLGMSVNAPVGLGVHFPQVNAASSGSGNSANVQTYNFAPTVAYKINDMVSVVPASRTIFTVAPKFAIPVVSKLAPPPLTFCEVERRRSAISSADSALLPTSAVRERAFAVIAMLPPTRDARTARKPRYSSTGNEVKSITVIPPEQSLRRE